MLSFPFAVARLLYSSPLVVFLGVAICFGQANGAAEAKLEQLSSEAQAAQQRGDYASAAKSYEELSRLRPDLGEIWANLGLMQQFMGDYSRADHDFQIALHKNAQLYVPNLFLGLNRLSAHQPRAAVGYLKAATALNKEDEQAALGLGRAYAGIQDDGNAVGWFDRASQINPRDPQAWYELGVTYLKLQDAAAVQLKNLDPHAVHARSLVADSFMEQGRFKDGILIYEKFRSEAHPPCLRSKLGLAYAQVGDVDKAKLAFQEEIRDQTGCLLADLGLARLAMVSGNFGEMLRQLHTIYECEPRFLHAYIQQIWTGLESEQVNSAVTELRKPTWAHDPVAAEAIAAANLESPSVHSAGPSEGHASINTAVAKERPEQLWTEGRYSACAETIRNLRGAQSPAHAVLLEQCSFYAGDYDLTLKTARQALQTVPHDVESLYWQAKSAQELAANSFVQMNAVAPDSPQGHLLMAEVHRAREEFAAAEADYKQVLESAELAEGEEVSAHLGLAHVYFHDSEDDKAIGELQSVLKADSSNADAHDLMGQLLVRRHQFDEAIPHLKLALQSLPPTSLPEVHSLLAKCYSARGAYAQALHELKPALTADTMGTYHYQLYQVYQKLGDQKSAAAALLKSEQLRQQKSRAEQEHTELTRP